VRRAPEGFLRKDDTANADPFTPTPNLCLTIPETNQKLEKRNTDWEPVHAEWTTKLHVVARTEPTPPVGPTLLQPSPARNGLPREVENPLDGMTWEERFWFAFQAILELERDLEELQVREEYFRCITCRRESGHL
jgi:hypothetical protein